MKPQPHYIPFKLWVAEKAIELNLTWHGAYYRWRRGNLKIPHIRRVNKRVLFVRV